MILFIHNQGWKNYKPNCRKYGKKGNFMSAGNFQYERKRNYELQKKTVTGTYTIKTGQAANNGVIDNPIDIADPAADFTLTLGSGDYMGQTVLVVMSSNTSSKTATLSITNHETSDPETLVHDAADEYTLLVWTGTEWATVSKTSTTS
jgi:hypothetical protein